ncbi:type IV toxin-antitoxin system AbiEi family antitoxin domain-containing protein [Marinobacter salexigens]|uniref:type IV toxin-antitoxin system AbiEi family antitoxin domain-containing protein n=1 Tax=Marinobacter salexigens TaxID=1925763 RepID=UPI0018789F93|nr:hypothetical protein [Marinobacter salexigens]
MKTTSGLPEQEDLARKIKQAMEAIEEYKPELDGILSKDECFTLTPTLVVKLMVEIEPRHGMLYDPASGLNRQLRENQLFPPLEPTILIRQAVARYQQVVTVCLIPALPDPPGYNSKPCSASTAARYRFSGRAFSEGIEQVTVDGITLQVYNPEKTLADCFKFRNRIGMDVVLEALELYRTRKTFRPGILMEYARICRVANVMAPYVEAKL